MGIITALTTLVEGGKVAGLTLTEWDALIEAVEKKEAEIDDLKSAIVAAISDKTRKAPFIPGFSPQQDWP